MLLNIRREFPEPSLTVFFSLQALDVITTLIGIRVGASEGSIFIGRLMQLGPVEGLLISKLFAVLLALSALRLKRPRLVVFLNYMFAVLIAWNLFTIFNTALSQ